MKSIENQIDKILQDGQAAIVDVQDKDALQAWRSQYTGRSSELAGILKNLNAYNPLSVLERGYSISSKDDKALKNTEGINSGDSIQIRLSRGKLNCTVRKIIKEN